MATLTNLRKMKNESSGVMQFLHSEAVNGFPNGNFLCSPALLDAGLGIIAAGAIGETLKQLLDFLGAECLEDLYLKSSGLKALGQSNNGLSASKTFADEYGPKLYFGNALWVDKNFTLAPSFVEVLGKVYDAAAKSVDFQNQVDRVVEDVNSWVKNATNGLIKDLVSQQSICADTILISTSALYFKAAWARGYQFNPRFTSDSAFYLLSGKRKLVPYMIMTCNEYDYGCFDGCQVLKIPYMQVGNSNQFSMYFVLPDKRDGLPQLIEKFHSNHELFQKCFNLGREMFVKIEIPKFKLSFNLNVKDELKKCGVVRLFEPHGEFTDISQAKGMYVQDILVKSWIEVNEEGTEAAAAFLSMRGGGSMPTPVLSFIADHPFMFIIKEEMSGALLFVGSVLDP